MRWSMASLRRDVRMVVDGLRGRHPPAVITSRISPVYPAVPDAGSAARARTLEVVEVRRETADAISLLLRDPTGRAIEVVPGQFFTVLVTVGGEELRRAYSASSSPLVTDTVTLTVKRIAGGRVSSYLHDHAAPGLRLAVLGPSGDFTVAADAAATRHVFAIAGGSGITPIMAITRAVLAAEPHSTVTVVYGNRDAAAIIFAAELDALAAAHPDRLRVRHVLEDAAGRPDARTGRLDAATVGALIADAAPDATFYVCGPEGMMAEARAALAARAVPAARIREERFTAPARREVARTATAQPVTIRRAGVALDVVVPPGATILDAGLAAGVPLRLSCAMGGCGACAVTLTAGEVVMDEPNCLTDVERARGTILACCARPLGPCTVEAAP